MLKSLPPQKKNFQLGILSILSFTLLGLNRQNRTQSVELFSNKKFKFPRIPLEFSPHHPRWELDILIPWEGIEGAGRGTGMEGKNLGRVFEENAHPNLRRLARDVIRRLCNKDRDQGPKEIGVIQGVPPNMTLDK